MQYAVLDPLDLDPLRRPTTPGQAAYYAGTFASEWDRGTISVDSEGHLEYLDTGGRQPGAGAA